MTVTVFQERKKLTQSEGMKVRPEFPLWLKRQRMLAGLSGRGLAEKAGIAQNLPSLLERREYLTKHQPDTDTCRKLAEALNADSDLVLYLAGHRDVDPRETMTVRPEIAVLQRKVAKIENLGDETRIQKAIAAANSFLDLLLGSGAG